MKKLIITLSLLTNCIVICSEHCNTIEKKQNYNSYLTINAIASGMTALKIITHAGVRICIERNSYIVGIAHDEVCTDMKHYNDIITGVIAMFTLVTCAKALIDYNKYSNKNPQKLKTFSNA